MAGDKEGRVSGSSLYKSDTDTKSDTDSAVDVGSSSPAIGASSHGNEILSNDPFGSEKSKLLFDAIDQLRVCGAGQHLALPQLVIVGKQSAGKSSLLESLTEIPFPAASGACTRFATRIISRRTPPGTKDIIHVSIEPGDVDPFENPEYEGQTASLNNSYTTMTAELFQDILKQASVAMGISTATGDGKNNFSSKVLKIELQGPTRSQFGILDLPGIFTSTINSITERDQESVQKMVISYMKRPENIIICVAVADDDLSNQGILGLTAANVKEPERIVGVFTKCDRVQDPRTIVDNVKDSTGISGKSLHHGWYVVRNRGPGEDRLTFNRDEIETSLFNGEPWNEIPRNRRGTAMLKNFLSTLLCQRIRKGFPGMKETVENNLAVERKHLKTLGQRRDTTALQRQHLVEITQAFQDLARKSLDTPYNLQSANMKLRGMLEILKENFLVKIRKDGNLHEFIDAGKEGADSKGDGDEEDSEKLSEKPLYKKIRHQIRENRAEELPGMVNPAVLKPLMQEQACKWPEIARDYLKELAKQTEDTSIAILSSVYKEKGGTKGEELEELVREFAKAGRCRALDHLDKAWREEVHRVQTSNLLFSSNVQQARFTRFAIALEKYIAKVPAGQFINRLFRDEHDFKVVPAKIYDNWAIVNNETSHTLFLKLHQRFDRNKEFEIHDILRVYYYLALEEFINYVDKHIAEPFLNDPSGPLLGLSTEYIIGLDNDKIGELGGEDEDTKKDRKRTEATIERLEAAKKIAEQTLRKTHALGDFVGKDY